MWRRRRRVQPARLLFLPLPRRARHARQAEAKVREIARPVGRYPPQAATGHASLPAAPDLKMKALLADCGVSALRNTTDASQMRPGLTSRTKVCPGGTFPACPCEIWRKMHNLDVDTNLHG